MKLLLLNSLSLATVVVLAGPLVQAATPTVLVSDNFNANTVNTTDLNVDIARQTGTKAPINYTMANGSGHYGHQLQNINAQNQLLVADFPNSTSSLNFNFNGANSAGGLLISFDVDPIPTVYGGTADNWGCLNLGASQADQLVNVNGGQTHFGILFRGAGTLQAFNGGAVVSPSPEPVYSTRPPGTTNHIDLVITDADGNPFDGIGNTTIEVFANGGLLPVWTYTRAGGYANNYINVQGSFRAHIDNLTVAQLPADRAPVIANPSFEADNFAVFPGYVSGNGPITGWNALPGHGVNPGTTFGPFTDNGTIPNGTKVAFLQEDGAMTQIIAGFTIGATYQIQYAENSRNCCSGTAPSVEVKVGGTTVVAAHAVPPVGGAAAYREVTSDPFVATSTSMELSFIKSNPQGGDTTLLLDYVRIIAPGTKPSITAEPQDTIIALGESGTLTVGAAGSAPLSYQWYFGSTPIVNGTSPTFTIQATTDAVAGNYYAVVMNSSGSATSRVARVTVRSRIPGLFNTGVDDSGVALADAAIDSHYRIVVNPDSASPDAIVENSGAFPIVAGPWVANNGGSKWVGPRFDTTGAAGAVGAGGDYVYRYVFDLAGFDPSTAVVTGLWATDNAGSDISINGQSTGQPNTTQFTSYTPFTISSGFVAGPNVIEFKLNNSAVGYTGLRVDQIRGLADPLPAGTRPFIIQQPQGAALVVGQTATFAVQANGSAPLSYQWYFGADPIPGATGSTYSFVIDFPDVAGNYSVEVTNPFGSLRSAAATLVVLAEPVILTQPQSRIAALGDTVTFSVSAIGEAPLTYQWSHGGQPIAGATQPSYTIASVTAADAGSYFVEVSNFSGSATSDTVTLSIADVVPGLFNTGVDASRVVLADGMVDPHYTIVVNADSASPTALVQDSTVFPIVAGPWLANDAESKWIGPRVETSAAAGGDYVYRTTFDLTGFDPATASVAGDWSTDNSGLDISINGVGTGQSNTGNFGAYTPFAVSSGFQAGVNTLEFKLNNAGLGYTGLRVRGLRVLAVPVLANKAPSFVKGPDITVAEDAPAQIVGSWATSISAGAGESGQTLTFLVSNDNPALFSGAPAISANGTLSFAVNPNANGQALVTVRLQDNGGTANGGVDTSAPQTFLIRVTPVNDCPTAASQSVSANTGSSVAITLTGSDIDGDTLTFAITTPPAHGTLSGTPPAVTYTPAAGYCGPDLFRFTVRDGTCTSSEATVNLTVSCLNRPPVASFEVAPLFAVTGLDYPTVLSPNGSNACVTLDGSLSSDPDGDALTYAWLLDGSPLPIATGVQATACLELGLHDITLVVTDAAGAPGTLTKRIEVITAAEAVDLLIDAVNNATLDRKNKRPFLATLKAAQASFDRGDTTAALNQLHAFENKVRAQVGRTQPLVAAEWIRLSQAIAAAVVPPAP
jgi:hypothetical protein